MGNQNVERWNRLAPANLDSNLKPISKYQAKSVLINKFTSLNLLKKNTLAPSMDRPRDLFMSVSCEITMKCFLSYFLKCVPNHAFLNFAHQQITLNLRTAVD